MACEQGQRTWTGYMDWTALPEESYFERSRDVAIFSRASLLLTFDLLRSSAPRLALEVRNITGGEPLSGDEIRVTGDDEIEDKNADSFRVELELEKVRAVVQELMEFTKPERVDINNPEINIMARALMQDWLILAHFLIAQEPLNKKPQPTPDSSRPM